MLLPLAVLDMGGSSPSLLTPFGPARTALALRPSGDVVLVFEGPTLDAFNALPKRRPDAALRACSHASLN